MKKIPFAGIELTSQYVRGLRGTSELPGRPADAIYKKLFFYRFNDRGAHLQTVDIWEQPLSVGP